MRQGLRSTDSAERNPNRASRHIQTRLDHQLRTRAAGSQGQQKLVLLDFTGSDWCGWCKLLDQEVFSKPQFKEYASKNLVLVEVDFPKMKADARGDLRTQNVQLAQPVSGFKGFPTIVLF